MNVKVEKVDKMASKFISFCRAFGTAASRCAADSSGVIGNPGGLYAGISISGQTLQQRMTEDMRLMNVVSTKASSDAANIASIPPRAITFHVSEVNGANIHFAKTGTGKHPVLLLPGAIGSAVTDFGPQLEGLNKDMFTVIAWDPRGYGKSQDSAREWSSHFLERDAHDAAKLMQNLEIDHYSLVGWSDGGITALIMAAKYPHRVRKCVSLAANSYVTKEEAASYEMMGDIRTWSKRMRQPFLELYGEEKFQKLWRDWIKYFSMYYTEHEGTICNHLLPDITSPVLVIQGEKDAMVPMFHAEYIVKNVPNATLVKFPDGKHNMHFKYAKEFNSLVEKFLAEPTKSQL